MDGALSQAEFLPPETTKWSFGYLILTVNLTILPFALLPIVILDFDHLLIDFLGISSGSSAPLPSPFQQIPQPIDAVRLADYEYPIRKRKGENTSGSQFSIREISTFHAFDI